MLWRLSVAVVTLLALVVGAVVGVELPIGRAGRGLTIFAMLGSSLAVVLLTARLVRQRQPDHPLAALAPEVVFRRAIDLARSSRARGSAAIHRRRRGGRVRRAELAAVEAAEHDSRLAPQSIRKSAEALFRLVYLAWDARDRARLATLLAPELLREWESLLDADEAAGVRQHVQLLGDMQIDLVGLTRTAAGGDEAIVLVEAELDVHVDDWRGNRISPRAGSPSAQRLCQYWTLALEDGPWMVHAIEERAEGERHLSEPIVARTGT